MKQAQLDAYGWNPQRLLLFDTFLAIITFYLLIEMGLTVFIDETDVTITKVMYWLDAVSVVALFAAFLVEFRRGYRYKGKLVLDRQKVIQRYHWLRIFLDVLTLVLIGLTLIPQFRLNPLRIIILWRFYYLYRTDQSYFRLVHNKTGWYVFYTFFKMLLIFYLFCHYTGCLYYWIDYYIHATNYYGPGQVTMMWTEYIYLWSPILAEPWYLQYMYTMYYSVETFTTIAYGDNTPKNPLETIFVTVFLIASAVMLSYIIEEIVMLFYQFLKMRFLYLRKLNAMRRYMIYKQVDPELEEVILRYYEYLWVQLRLIKSKDQSELSEIIGKLPRLVRSELYYQLLRKYFESMEWMMELPYVLYDELLEMCKERVVLPGEIIYQVTL